MAQKVSVFDKYVNLVRCGGGAGISISATHATISTPGKVSTSWNPKDQLGCVIKQVNYIFDSTLLNLDAATDQFKVGLCVTAAQPTAGFNASSAGLLDYNRITTQYGTLVGGFKLSQTLQKRYDYMPSGGILCHPASLYYWYHNDSTADWAAAVNLEIEIYYQLVELSPEDWQEMWQLGYITNII